MWVSRFHTQYDVSESNARNIHIQFQMSRTPDWHRYGLCKHFFMYYRPELLPLVLQLVKFIHPLHSWFFKPYYVFTNRVELQMVTAKYLNVAETNFILSVMRTESSIVLNSSKIKINNLTFYRFLENYLHFCHLKIF